MRAHNEFVAGNWTEPYIIPRNIDSQFMHVCIRMYSTEVHLMCCPDELLGHLFRMSCAVQ